MSDILKAATTIVDKATKVAEELFNQCDEDPAWKALMGEIAPVLVKNPSLRDILVKTYKYGVQTGLRGMIRRAPEITRTVIEEINRLENR